MLWIRDIMTRDVKTLAPDTTIRAAMDFLAANHLSGAPVVNGHSVVGVVSATDLLNFTANIESEMPFVSLPEITWADHEGRDAMADADVSAPAFFAESWEPDAEEPDIAAGYPTVEPNALDEHDVSEVMTRNLWTLPSTASARDAAALMETHGIHRVLIVDNEDLVGIVSALDVTRAVANGQFTVRTYVFNHDSDFS